MAVTLRSELLSRIHSLWDRLADYEAAELDTALRHLLAVSARAVSAQNAYWLGVVRVLEDETDGHLGWRPRAIRYLRGSLADVQYASRSLRDFSRGTVDSPEETQAHVRRAGRFRALPLSDLDLSPTAIQGLREQYRRRGVHDVMWVAIPLSVDAESYYGFHRKLPGAFGEEQLETAAYVMRGLRWFHRRVMLSHGLLAADAPLAPAERRVVAHLLTGQSEKEIASSLGLTVATTHKYVTDLLRKFGVSGRAGLTALWLGAPGAEAPPSDSKG